MEKSEKIWLNGQLVEWDQAKIHFLTQGLHYGGGVFEGIRCYQTPNGPAIFRLKDHVKRLIKSARTLGMKIPYTQNSISKAIKETVRENKLSECYIRPCAYFGYGVMGLNTLSSTVDLGIAAWPWGAYLGEEGLTKGIRCKISAFSRYNLNPTIHGAKICGVYFNSILAKRDALLSKYDEAILLDDKGYITEGSGENIFMVKRNRLYTTPLGMVLEGITRNTVIQLAGDLGYSSFDRKYKVSKLLQADELFFTGTAAEVTPIREVDQTIIGNGKPGEITLVIQQEYFKVIRGESSRYKKWLDYI